MRPRPILAALAIAALALGVVPVQAHHGWSWTTGQNIDLTGVIHETSLGMPHGIVYVDVEGEVWTVEVGQPWRNQRAGIDEKDLVEGVEIRVIGEPSADIADRRVKAEKVFLGGVEHDLYPDRN